MPADVVIVDAAADMIQAEISHTLTSLSRPQEQEEDHLSTKGYQYINTNDNKLFTFGMKSIHPRLLPGCVAFRTWLSIPQPLSDSQS